jgi:hypothetical protein
VELIDKFLLGYRDDNEPVTIGMDVLIDFLQQAIDGGKGFSRDVWRPTLGRDRYDCLMNKLVQHQVVGGRKPGFSGEKLVDTYVQACELLGIAWHNVT